MSRSQSLVLLVVLFGCAPAEETGSPVAAARAMEEAVVIERTNPICHLDPNCFNRIHSDIEAVASAKPGQLIVLGTRNAVDFDTDPESSFEDPRVGVVPGSTVHPLTGPVHIEGAVAGDVIAVTLVDVKPGNWGFTIISPIGYLADVYEGRSLRANWRLGPDFATSDQMPGIRIANASFPGILTVLPSRELLDTMIARETALLEAGGRVNPPEATHASPSALCGPEGTARDECLRTAPPREHGGNMDIRYMQAGTTIYLPCFIDGCGLAAGDAHYAQGDGEVSGTGIEMDATISLRVENLGPGDLPRGPHFEGPAHLLGYPTDRFYATTGFPLKETDWQPPDMEYLQSAVAPGLSNLSKDLNLAARNALLEMIDYLVEERGLTMEQAYLLCSVSVDLRIGQLVDAPNVGAMAVLPLDVFTD